MLRRPSFPPSAACQDATSGFSCTDGRSFLLRRPLVIDHVAVLGVNRDPDRPPFVDCQLLALLLRGIPGETRLPAPVASESPMIGDVVRRVGIAADLRLR